jgi:hypothetical protein
MPFRQAREAQESKESEKALMTRDETQEAENSQEAQIGESWRFHDTGLQFVVKITSVEKRLAAAAHSPRSHAY